MASISVVGLGKLGAPLAAVLADNGHTVVGVDTFLEVIARFNHSPTSLSPLQEPGLQEMMDENHERLRATKDYKDAIQNTDVTFVVVPTPSHEVSPRFSNAYVCNAMHLIGAALRGKETWHLVVVVSTIMPGATEGIISESLAEGLGGSATEVGICYSPEFIALGSVIEDLTHPDLILIGESDPHSGDVLEAILLSICKNQPAVHRMKIINAEIAKLSINTYVTMKLSFANCLAEICEAVPGADATVVSRALGADTRIGSKYILPATAYGGPCFPRDTKAFFAFANDSYVTANLAESTARINDRQTSRLALDIRGTKKPKTKTGILGLSYKPGTGIYDESPGVNLANELVTMGDQVVVFDPAVKRCPDLNRRVEWADSALDLVSRVGVVAIMTPWPEFQNIPLAAFTGMTVWDCWSVLSVPDDCESVDVKKTGRGPK